MLLRRRHGDHESGFRHDIMREMAKSTRAYKDINEGAERAKSTHVEDMSCRSSSAQAEMRDAHLRCIPHVPGAAKDAPASIQPPCAVAPSEVRQRGTQGRAAICASACRRRRVTPSHGEERGGSGSAAQRAAASRSALAVRRPRQRHAASRRRAVWRRVCLRPGAVLRYAAHVPTVDRDSRRRQAGKR